MAYTLNTFDSSSDFDGSSFASYFNDKALRNFQPEHLTLRIRESGDLSGDFDEYESMALAGEIIILLSHRSQPPFSSSASLHLMVSTFLTNKGYEKASQVYERLYCNVEEKLAAAEAARELKICEPNLGNSDSFLTPVSFSLDKVESFLTTIADYIY